MTILESKADKDTVYINLDPDRSDRKTKISSKLTDREKMLFTNFLRVNKTYSHGR